VTSRNDLAQQPPQPGQDLSSFPAVDGPAARQWRAHSVSFGPWFFGTTGAGRFDLPDTGDDGTCYFADEVETAVRESLGPRLSADQTVTPDLAAAFTVSAIVPPSPRPHADVNDKAAVRYGVTRELTTTVRYDVTNAWADAFHQAGFDGVRYASRFTTEAAANSWSLFGPKGPAASLAVVGAEQLTGADACAAAGITVLAPPPAKRALQII